MKKTTTILLTTCLFLTLSACAPVEGTKEMSKIGGDTETEVKDETITDEPAPLEPKEKTADDAVLLYLEDEVESNDYEYFNFYENCNNNYFPFKSDKFGNVHGQFTFTGTVETSEEPTPFAEDDSTTTFVRMIVNENDSPEAEQYFLEMIEEGNTVNDKVGDKLAFYMGIIEDGEWAVRAKNSDSKKEVMSSIKSGEEITLKLTHSFQEGMGATVKHSFACEIEAI